MSLAQHVTQDEGFDHNLLRQGDEHASITNGQVPLPTPVHVSGRTEWHRMSFAPAKSVYREDHIAAYKVSSIKRCGKFSYDNYGATGLLTDNCAAQVVTSILACWLSSGIVFGFAALKPVLVAEGIYRELCDFNTTASRYEYASHEIPCGAQDLALNFFFIVASVTANVASLLAGSALDRFGRRTCWVVACASLTLGSVLMGASFAIPDMDGYLLANALLSLGGTFIFVSSFQLANAFPKHSGMIVAMVTGAFDASAAVFLIYRMIFEATAGGITLQKFFFGYTAVPAFIAIAEFAYMPRVSYHTINELERSIGRAQDDSGDIHGSDQDISDTEELARIHGARAHQRMAKLSQLENIAGDDEQREQRRRTKETRQAASGVWGVLHGTPAHKQILSPWFLLMLLLTAFQMLRMNFFIATIRAQYRYMLRSEPLAAGINRFFDVALPIGGVVSTPVIGLLLNNFSVSMVFACITIFIVAIGVLNCLPLVWAGYATVVVFVVFRPLYYSAIS